MVVVSQLQFGDYLNKPCYAPAAAQLPRPLTLATKLRRGDFDILIIHSQYGLMVGEIKSVGANMADLNLTPEKQEAVLRKKLGQAVSQLDKAETVLRHVVSDLVTALTIRKTVMLPHITSGQLLQVLKDSSTDGQALARAFRACLGATTGRGGCELQFVRRPAVL
ncbi:uncharacterized protein LOC112555092 [Pomacea canaliculata]|uniref:uncharacterized protein LOC112555092 n=1 Tax=Pomacea canaliculata TaxID=400727 RepID=UPI000D73AF43|nr:uncharacterized protein LOC112555092 [Pomacea canaliculata]